ncbi:MAG: hypothetical protein RL259_666 [Bacteroidota bacterium]|jgi:hypothetical protein
MSRKIALLLVALVVTSLSFGQKKEKIKGSKIVTVAIKELPNFETIEVGDNFEILLVKGDKPSIEIEADDNLHEIINYEVSGNVLKINALKEATGYKKFTIRINYTNDLQLITARNEAEIKALAAIELEKITVKNHHNSKSFLNVNSNYFALILDDKAEAEINVKAESTSVELSKNSELKALIASTEFKLDMYQKSTALIEGTATNAKMRLDNSSHLTAPKFVMGTVELETDATAKCEINTSIAITIAAAGKSQVELWGDQKITIKKFANNATLQKKEK